MVENSSKFLRTKNKLPKIASFEQNVAQKCTPALPIKSKPRSATPTRDRRRARTLSRTYECQNHARASVRREHQARTHVRTSEESTKRTVHIQQWGSHPLSLAGRARPGPAKRNETSNKLSDLEKATASLHNLCIWPALIVVTIISLGTARISASSAR